MTCQYLIVVLVGLAALEADRLVSIMFDWLRNVIDRVYPYRAYEENEYVNTFLEKCISKGRLITYDKYEIVVCVDNKYYSLWNSNYPYGWLSYGYIITNEDVIYTDSYDNTKHITKTIIQKNPVWEKYQPSKAVAKKFEQWLTEQNGAPVVIDSHRVREDLKYIDTKLLNG